MIIVMVGNRMLLLLKYRYCSSISSNSCGDRYMCYGGVNNLLVVEKVKSFVCCRTNERLESCT